MTRRFFSSFLRIIFNIHLIFTMLVTTRCLTILDGKYEELTISLVPSIGLDELQCLQYLEQIEDTMNSASSFLHRATNQMLYIESVNVLIPSYWDQSYCGRLYVPSYMGGTENVDINIGCTHRIFGDNPFTRQPRQCGLPGEFIYFSWNFINQTDGETKARLFVHEWAKYRWGSFEEYGHEADPIYPHTYINASGYYVETGCSDINVGNSIRIRDRCLDKDDPCYQETENPPAEQTSSLLSYPLYPTVVDFCDPARHDTASPTKQNVLCDYRSVWELIEMHGDSIHFTHSSVIPPIKLDVLKWRKIPSNGDINEDDTTQEEPSGKAVNIILRTWASQPFDNLYYGAHTAPAIFAEVFDFSQSYYLTSVLGCQVELEVENLSFTLKLRDTGTGADVTGNDGIYSGFLVGLTEGGSYDLDIKLLASTAYLSPDLRYNQTYLTCCGSSLFFPEGIELQEIEVPAKMVSKSAFVNSSIPLVLPPSKITDLKATDRNNGTVSLVFTTPGQDLDQGEEASKYHVLYLIGDSGKWYEGIILHNNQSAGEIHDEIFPFPLSCSEVITFTIRAEDEEGHMSQDSNVVRIKLDCNGDPPSTDDGDGGDGGGGEDDDGLSGGAIAGIVIGAVLAVLLIIGGIYLYWTYDEKEANWLWGIVTCKLCYPGRNISRY